MKVKKYTVTSAQINSNTYTELEINYVDAQGHVYYPKALEFQNNTNANLNFLYLANTDEKAETVTLPSYYEYLDLVAGKSVADLPKTQFIRIIKKDSSTAIADLIFYAYNFSTWQR